MSNYFISTTIPYVNSKPHVGFALELVQADVIARYRRLCGDHVTFQSGTDENSLKNVLAAREAGVEVRTHVDEHSNEFKRLSERLGISLDLFVRTSSESHQRSVHDFWKRIDPQDLYEKNYSGLYCVGCEDFLQESDLIEGRCPDHGIAPERIEEENIFFRLSRYESRVADLIERDAIRITPSFRKKEILNFIDQGLEDISVSRNSERCGGWGISVPGNARQTIYVWIDALINYISGFTPGSWENTHKVHFIGKNVWKFHAIYWPALLLSAGLGLPDEIVVHGFLTLAGNKISKSKGPVIDPFELLRDFGSDSLRFYLLRSFSPFEDGDFSLAKFKEIHNSYLVNGLGNLVSRLLSLAARSRVAPSEQVLSPKPITGLQSALESYRFDEGLGCIWREVGKLNGEIASARPWESLGLPQTQKQIASWLCELWNLGYWLGPFLPETGQRICESIGNATGNRAHLFERIN